MAVAYLLTFLRDSLTAALARRRAAALLESLSDRQLADVGIDRSEIPSHLRSTCPLPVWCAAPCPVCRPSLQGCG